MLTAFTILDKEEPRSAFKAWLFTWFLSSHAMTSLHLSTIVFLSSGLILSWSFSSSTVLFMLKARDSREFLAVTFSLWTSSSALNCSASCTMRSMSSLLNRPVTELNFFPLHSCIGFDFFIINLLLDIWISMYFFVIVPLSLVIVILFSFPVLLSTADTLRMPFASMSKVTSIWGTPLGAGGIPVSSNFPRMLLSLVMALSPSYTWKQLFIL